MFLLVLLSVSALCLPPSREAQAQPATAPGTIEMFTREGCPRCAKAKEFLDQLAPKRPDVSIIVHDVGADPAALAELRRLAAEHDVTAPGLPSFLVRGTFVTGFVSAETTGARLVDALERQPGAARTEPELGSAEGGACPVEPMAPCPETATPRGGSGIDDTVDLPVVGRLSARGLGLPLFTVAMGLLDGFNPCAMWVLLLLLSFLVGLRDRSKMLVVGGTFVFVSGAIYFAFMAAWLNVFLLIGVSRAVQITLGAIALTVGATHVKDFFAFKKGVSLSIPESSKPGLYRRMRAVARAEHVPAAIGGAAVLAVLVNVIELLCTAGLPAIYTRVLTLRALPGWQYYGYLLLYNVAYVADDTLMLTIAVLTLGRRKLQEREGRWLKLVSGLVMAALGAVLLIKPTVLA